VLEITIFLYNGEPGPVMLSASTASTAIPGPASKPRMIAEFFVNPVSSTKFAVCGALSDRVVLICRIATLLSPLPKFFCVIRKLQNIS
jgi:hypothetical protein